MRQCGLLYRQRMHLQTEHAPTDWKHAYHQVLLESNSSCRRACTHIQGPNRRQSHSEMQYLHERQMQIGITLMKCDVVVRVTASQRACRYTHIHSLCKLLTAQNGIGGCGTDQHGGSAHSTCNIVDPQTILVAFCAPGNNVCKSSYAKHPSLIELLHSTMQDGLSVRTPQVIVYRQRAEL